MFGGKNGNGKTTLFEAFRVCLYGSSVPEFRGAKLDYQDYIRRRIHKSSGLVLQPVSAIISLEFDYARLGHVDKYNLERRWHISSEQGSIDEEFEIVPNGKLLEELDN